MPRLEETIESHGKVSELMGHLMPGTVKAFPAGTLEEDYDWIK